MVEKMFKTKSVQFILFFIGFGLLAYGLKHLSFIQVAIIGPLVLLVSGSVVYQTSSHMQKKVQQYLKRKGIIKGILYPFITFMQVLCLLAYLNFDPSVSVISRGNEEEIRRSQFLSNFSGVSVFFLMNIRLLLTNYLDQNKSLLTWLMTFVILAVYIWLAMKYKMTGGTFL